MTDPNPNTITSLNFIKQIGHLLHTGATYVARIEDTEVGPKGKAYLQKQALILGEMYMHALAQCVIASGFMDEVTAEQVVSPKALADVEKGWASL